MTKAKINKAIKRLGLTIEGTRGDGYFYFLNENGDHVGSSIYVPYLNCQPLEDWVLDAENCIKENEPK